MYIFLRKHEENPKISSKSALHQARFTNVCHKDQRLEDDPELAKSRYGVVIVRTFDCHNRCLESTYSLDKQWTLAQSVRWFERNPFVWRLCNELTAA